MAERSSRSGAVDMGVVLMVLSFVVIGIFFYWLQAQAAAERAAATVVEDTTDDAPADDPFADAATVAPTDLVTGAGAGQYVGQVVRVQTQVASALGRQGFWLDIPQSPFLVSYSDELLADSVVAAPGSSVTVTGTVLAMNDSISGAWLESGRITEGDQLAASFSSFFIEADRIQARGGN